MVDPNITIPLPEKLWQGPVYVGDNPWIPDINYVGMTFEFPVTAFRQGPGTSDTATLLVGSQKGFGLITIEHRVPTSNPEVWQNLPLRAVITKSGNDEQGTQAVELDLHGLGPLVAIIVRVQLDPTAVPGGNGFLLTSLLQVTSDTFEMIVGFTDGFGR